ncbi:MAG: tRNA pseudouridine(55) synthase TruB [Lachnospiraceae bacterium]|nr:tRNA pseudouridine(55) synthase TruB [Lachnospiraceae bacterium]
MNNTDKKSPLNGVLNVYKEADYTSFDVVAKLRGILKIKKIGHTGTLDPKATGVLPVCIGNATKLCDMLTDKSKEYRALMRLGVKTDTLDVFGRVEKTCGMDRILSLKEDEIISVIKSFEGDIKQTPPMYSALKVNGKRLYELARQGIVTERKKRDIHIERIDIEDISLPFISFTVACSKGTYIRSLCDDIGEKLGVYGAMEALVRLRSGEFGISEAKSLGEIEKVYGKGDIRELIIPVDRIFEGLSELSIKTLSGEEGLFYNKLLKNGNSLPAEALKRPMLDKESFRVYDKEGSFSGIYEYRKDDDRLYPVKLFL